MRAAVRTAARPLRATCRCTPAGVRGPASGLHPTDRIRSLPNTDETQGVENLLNIVLDTDMNLLITVLDTVETQGVENLLIIVLDTDMSRVTGCPGYARSAPHGEASAGRAGAGRSHRSSASPPSMPATVATTSATRRQRIQATTWRSQDRHRLPAARRCRRPP